MALKTPMFLELNTTSQNADEFRNMIRALTSATGVCAAGDFAVSQRSAGPNMSIDVAAGNIIIPGSENTHQGYYSLLNDAVVNLTVTAANATNPRKDLVIVRVRDQAYSGANNDAELLVLAGTPAGSPVEPDPVALGYKNYAVLAMIDVPANDTTIGDAQITDRRTRATAAGGTIICTSTTRPASPYEGMHIYEKDTDRTLRYDGTNWGFGTNYNGGEIVDPIVVGARDKKTTASVSGSVTIDAAAAALHVLTMTGNVTSITVNNFDDGESIRVMWIEDATGGRTIAFPGAWLWPGGAASNTPFFKTTANAKNMLALEKVGSDVVAFLGGELKV